MNDAAALLGQGPRAIKKTHSAGTKLAFLLVYFLPHLPVQVYLHSTHSARDEQIASRCQSLSFMTYAVL